VSQTTPRKKRGDLGGTIATLLAKNADFNGVCLTLGGARHRRVDQRRRAALGSASAVFSVAVVNQIPIAIALVVAQV